MLFEAILAVASLLAGAIASVAGFGIGSLLTPLLSIKTGIGIAVAGVSIAHFLGTALRFFYLRKSVNRQIVLKFGLMSAAGGLTGALLHDTFQNPVLTIVFGCMLILAGISGLTGLSDKVKIRGILVWLAGGISGLLGGLVGNQGSIRSAALISFKLEKDEFIATATAVAIMVDIARVPAYLVTQWEQLTQIYGLILITTIGVLAGTIGGKKIAEKLPERIFKKIVSAIILIIGIWILTGYP